MSWDDTPSISPNTGLRTTRTATPMTSPPYTPGRLRALSINSHPRMNITTPLLVNTAVRKVFLRFSSMPYTVSLSEA